EERVAADRALALVGRAVQLMGKDRRRRNARCNAERSRGRSVAAGRRARVFARIRGCAAGRREEFGDVRCAYGAFLRNAELDVVDDLPFQAGLPCPGRTCAVIAREASRTLECQVAGKLHILDNGDTHFAVAFADAEAAVRRHDLVVADEVADLKIVVGSDGRSFLTIFGAHTDADRILCPGAPDAELVEIADQVQL